MTGFSKRVAQLPTYPMAELPAIKRRLIEQGVDVIDVGAGDADFAPPEIAVNALGRALQDPAMSRYAFQLGLPAFREAAAAYMQRRFKALPISRPRSSIPAMPPSCPSPATRSITAARSWLMPSRTR